MKTIFKKFTALLFLAFVVACNKNDGIPIITPANMISNELTLSDIADEVGYIKLDNSFLLSEIKDIKKTEDRYFIRTSDGLFCFDSDGIFIRQIGKKGKGPQEYSWVSDFTLDKDMGLIYLIDHKKVMVFTFLGELKTIFPTPGEHSLSNIYFYNNHLYFPKGFGFGGLETEWFETDTSGNVIRKKNNYIANIKPMVEYSPNLMFYNDKGLYYWNQLNDTIFSVDKNIEPAYWFAKDKFRITATDLQSEDNYRNKASWQLLSLQATNRFMVFDYLLLKDKKEIFAIYDITKRKMYEWQVLDNFEARGVNTFDSGPVFIPKSISKINNDEYFTSWVDSYLLKAHIASEAFKNSTPEFSEKKEGLEQLANSLDENDNPVLVLVRLKE